MKNRCYLASSLIVWCIYFILLLRRYRGILELDPEDQKLMYYSESAFYLSFYYDVIEARDRGEVWTTLVNDDRTEFPEVVIAFKRLNIFQEITLGLIYRLMNLKRFIHSPFNFYAISVLIINAGGISALFYLACKCGRSPLGGILFLGLYLSNFRGKLISRIAALPLRENFAIPGLWISLVCLDGIMDNGKDSKNPYYKILFASYSWMYLTWQLSLHIVATQLGCLFLMNLVGVLSDFCLQKTTKVALGALLLSWVVTLFPSFTIKSPLTTGGFALLASSVISLKNDHILGTYRKRALKFLLALAVFCLENIILSFTHRHDSHIFGILLSKVGMSKRSFDSQIYLLGSEFRMLSIDLIKSIRNTMLFHYAFAAALVVALISFKRNGKKVGLNTSYSLYLVLQTIVFIFMAILISRLRVLALPLLCLFSSYSLLLMRLPALENLATVGVFLALVIRPYITTISMHELRVEPLGEMYNTNSLKHLMSWVNDYIEPGTPILSDMPTSSALRIATKTRIIVNPQFEYIPQRRKTEFYYTLGSCNDARWFGETMNKSYQSNIVIVPVKYCSIPARDIDEYGINSVLELNTLGSCPPNTPYHRRLCNRLMAGDGNFEQLFGNRKYLVFRYRAEQATNEEPRWSSVKSLLHYKPWIENHVVKDAVNGPYQIHSTAIILHRNYKLEVAMPLLKYGLHVFPGNELMLRLYADSMDYDFSMFDEAYKHYKELVERMDYRCASAEDLLFYIAYLSHMVEVGNGDIAEIEKVIKASEKCLGLNYRRRHGHDLCEHAMNILQALRKRLGARHTYARDLAVKFFQLSQEVNHQNECFFNSYKTFYTKELTTWDTVLMFLTNR